MCSINRGTTDFLSSILEFRFGLTSLAFSHIFEFLIDVIFSTLVVEGGVPLLELPASFLAFVGGGVSDFNILEYWVQVLLTEDASDGTPLQALTIMFTARLDGFNADKNKSDDFAQRIKSS